MQIDSANYPGCGSWLSRTKNQTNQTNPEIELEEKSFCSNAFVFRVKLEISVEVHDRNFQNVETLRVSGGDWVKIVTDHENGN